jgi:RWD domain
MDHQHEKAQELESLSYIYIEEELEILDASTLIVRIRTDDEDIPNEEGDWLVEITFKLPEHYPETIPAIEIESNLLGDDQVEELVEKSLIQCKESLGDAMIFTIASWIKEESEAMIRKRMQEAEINKGLELERLELEEKARYQGTKVTLDSFMEWQKGFIKEARLSLKHNGGNLDKICVAL